MRMVAKVGLVKAIPAYSNFHALPFPSIPCCCCCCPKAEGVLKACWQRSPLLHLRTETQYFSARLCSGQSCWGRHGRIAIVSQQNISDKSSDGFKKARRRRGSIDSGLGKRSSRRSEKLKRHHEDESCKDWRIMSEFRQEADEHADGSLPRNRFHQQFSRLGHPWNSIAASIQEKKVSPKKHKRRKRSRLISEGTHPHACDQPLEIARSAVSQDLRNADAGQQVFLPKESSGNMNRLSPSLQDYAKRGFQDGLWCWQTVQEPIKGLSELFASISCYRNTLYGQFCIGTLGLVAFVSIIYKGHSSISQMSQRQSVKKRILRSRWFSEGKSGIDRRRLLQRTKGQQLQTTFDRYSPKNSEREDAHRYNGLVVHDGELVRNGFGAGMQKSTHSNYDQQGSSHQSAHISRPSIASLLASTDQSYNRHRGEVSQESNSTASANTQGSKSEQANESFLEKVGSFFTKTFPVASQHSMHKSNKLSPNGIEEIQDIAKRETMYPSIKESIIEPRTLSRSASIMGDSQRKWKKEDELDLRVHIEELHKSVLAAEENRLAAMRALTEEKRRSLELEVKIRRQKEAAVALEEEVRVLKESHDTLLRSLRKKYSSSVSARAAAALLYQTWETTGKGSIQKESF